MPVHCPRCGSTKMKTLPVIYGGGTTDRSSISVTSKGRVRTGTGRRQTQLAASAAPPRGPSLIFRLLGMLVIFLLTTWLIGKVGPVVIPWFHDQGRGLWLRFGFLVPIVVAVLILFIGLLRYSANRHQYVRRLGEWENTWMCLQCGGTWM